MKKLSKDQWVAVFASLAFLGYILFAGPMMNLFNLLSTNAEDTSAPPQVPQTGVVIKEISIGEGLLAESGDTLTVHYVGTLSDGKVFDSSLDRNTPFSFILGVGQVIRGWDEGFSGMRVGGKRLLIVAPDYGYGAQGVGTIPPNSTLIFEVELLDVKKASSR